MSDKLEKYIEEEILEVGNELYIPFKEKNKSNKDEIIVYYYEHENGGFDESGINRDVAVIFTKDMNLIRVDTYDQNCANFSADLIKEISDKINTSSIKSRDEIEAELQKNYEDSL